MTETLTETARRIFAAGVAAADPVQAVRRALEERPLAPVTGRRVVIAVGKAAIGMAEAAQVVLPDIDRVLIVTNYENTREVPGAEVFAAGHPVPDEGGEAAAKAVIAALSELGSEDAVLALISGGGSALLPAPAEGLTLADKARVNSLLLASGADITEMNLVRQQLSRLKGGGVLRVASPAQVTSLILSDVVGDDLRVIASGPTVSPIGTRAEAVALCEARGIWDDLPEAVRRNLEHEDDIQADLPTADNRLIGSNGISVAAMAREADGALVAPEPLEGDVEDAARLVADVATGGGCWLFGGETTVRIKGDGLGGRNQELAMRVALEAEARGWSGDWAFLSGGTDGRDGPTDAAGGLVGPDTLARMRAEGVDPQAALARNDSYHALNAAGALLMTGATGTNVADLQVLIRTG
ncbi:MAG: DUF4147 domain-containing protein [Rhodobacteraceae bacterium]|nr:DUF4147 domain-containing protein [Paracoccaceae bacterium]